MSQFVVYQKKLISSYSDNWLIIKVISDFKKMPGTFYGFSFTNVKIFCFSCLKIAGNWFILMFGLMTRRRFELCLIVSIIQNKWIDQENNQQIKPWWKSLAAALNKISLKNEFHFNQLQQTNVKHELVTIYNTLAYYITRYHYFDFSNIFSVGLLLVELLQCGIGTFLLK